MRYLTDTHVKSGLTDTDVHPIVACMFDHTTAKKARLEQGITPTALAAHLGVSERTVTRWEAGKGQPDYSTGLLMEAVLGLTPGALHVADGQTQAPTDAAATSPVGA